MQTMDSVTASPIMTHQHTRLESSHPGACDEEGSEEQRIRRENKDMHTSTVRGAHTMEPCGKSAFNITMWPKCIACV